MAYEINELKRFLLMTLLSLPGVAMTNINCHGKPFHCINSTHFIICVDMGGGVTTTIDNFMIPCPPTTVCHETNRYECEFPPSDPKPPPEVIGISNESEDSVLSSVTNSATTTKPSSILLLDTTIEINAEPTEQVNLKQRPKFEVPDKLIAQPDTLKIMGTNQMTTNYSKSQTKLTDVTESSHNQSGLIHSTTETYKETNLTGSSTFTSDANIDTFNLTTTTESNPNHSNIENISSNVPPDISLPKTSIFSEVSIETTTTIADFGSLNYSVVNNTQNNLNSTPVSFSTTEPMPSTNDPNYKSNNYTTPLPILQSISIADYHTKPQQNITSTEAHLDYNNSKGYDDKQLNNITIPPVLSIESSNNSKSEYKKTNNPETTYIEKTLDKYNVDNKSSNTTESQNNNSVNQNKSNVVESTNSSLISDQDSKLNDETFQNLTTISTTDAPKITTFDRSTEIPLVTSSFLDNKNASSSKSNDLRLKMALTKEELPNTTGIDIKVEYTISGNSIVLNTNLTQNTHKIPENGNEYSNNSQGLEMDLSNTTQSNITVTFTLSNVVSHETKLNHSVLSYEKSNQSLNNSNLNSTNHSFNNISANNYGNKNITMGTLPGEYKNNLTETLNYTQIEKNTTKDKNYNYTETATNIVISKEETKDYQVKLETTQESAAKLTDIAINGNTDSLSIVNNNTNYSTITNNTIMFDNSTNKANNSIKLDDNVALVLKQYNASNTTITKQDATNQSLNQSKINNSKIPLYDISKQSDFSDISLQNNSFVITSTNNTLIHLSSLSGNFTNVINKTVIVLPQDLSIPNELNLTTPGEVFTTDTSNTTNNNVLYNQTVIYDPISYNNASDLSILNKKDPNNTTTTGAIESNTKLSAIKNERQTTVAPLLKTTNQIDAFSSESIPSTVKYHINAFSNPNQLKNLAVTMKKNQSSLSTVTDNVDFIPVTLKPNKETSPLFTRNTTVTTTQKAIVLATTRDWTTPTETSTIPSITKLSIMEDKEKPTTVAPVKTTNQIHDIQSVSILSSNISLSSTVKNDTNPNQSENLVVTMKTIPSDLSTVTTKIDTIPIALKSYKATTLSLTSSTSATNSDTSFVTKKAMAQAAASDLTNKQGPKVTNTTGVIENITILSDMKDKEKQTTVAPVKITDQLNDILLVSNSSSTPILSSTVKYDSNVYSNQNQSKNLAVTMKTNRSNLSTVTDNIDFIPVTLKPNKETSPILTRNTTVTTTDTSFVTQKVIVQATTRDWITPTETSTIRSITKLSTMEDKEKPTIVAPVKTTNQINDIQSISILSSNISLSSTVKIETNPNQSENFVVTMQTIPSDLSTVTTKIDTIPITVKAYKATTPSFTSSKTATSSGTSFVTKKAMAQAATSDLTNKPGPKDTNTTGEKQTTVSLAEITDQLNDILLVSSPSSTTLPSSTVKYDSKVYSNQNQSKHLVVTTKTIQNNLSMVTAKVETLPVTSKPYTSYSTSETIPIVISTTMSTHTSFVTPKAMTQATQQTVLKITPSETKPKQQVQDNKMDASTVIHGEMKLTTATYLNLQETVQTTKIPSDMTGKVTDTKVPFNTGIPTQINKPESLKFVTQSFTTQTENQTVNVDIKSTTEKYLYPTQSNADIHHDGRINNTTTLVKQNLKVNTKTVSINKTVSQFINGDMTVIQSLNDTNGIAKNQTVLKLNLLKENIYNIKMPETNILTTVEPNSMIETIEVNQNKTITAHLGDLILSEGMYAKVTSKSSSKLDTSKISTEVISHEVKEIKHIKKNLAEQFLPEKLEVQSTAHNNFKASVVSEASVTKQTNMIKPYASFHNTSVNNLQGIPTANTTAKQSNISLNTININIKTIIMSNSNKKNPNTSASVFDCSNRSRGRYADNNDCIKFYICIGKLQPITGFCPNNTVFSAIYKHCTKNLSHCVRNNQFRCLREGRFSDFFQDNVYYVCVKSSNNSFLRFKLQCQKDHQLNKTTMTCQKIADMSSQSFSSISESEVSNNRSIPKKSPETITKASFICPKEGRFSHATDSRKYYECKKNNKEEYRQRIRKCACDEIYSEKKQKCIESDSNDC